MTYFKNVSTLEELKKEYRNLVFIHHPDIGGSTQTMQIINNEYSRLFSTLKNTHKNKDGEFYETKSTDETPNDWIELINQLIMLNMQNVVIEVIGSFLWVSGDTKPYKDQLGKNGIGLKWSNNKQSWYKSPDGYRRFSKKDFKLDDIRGMYGSKTVKSNSQKSLT